MTWRDMLVHVKANEDWSEHIDVAMQLAKNFDARLTGLRTSQNAATIKQYLATNSERSLRRKRGRRRLPARRSGAFGMP